MKANSVKTLCVNCKANVPYLLTLQCQHKICFKCGEKLIRQDRFEQESIFIFNIEKYFIQQLEKQNIKLKENLKKSKQQNSLTCPHCKVVSQTSGINKLQQNIQENVNEFQENIKQNQHTSQQIGNINDQSGGNSNLEQKNELSYYLNQEQQDLQQMEDQGQIIQNEVVDEDFQFQNTNTVDYQMNLYHYQLQKNAQNNINDHNFLQQQNNYNNYKDIIQMGQQNQENEFLEFDDTQDNLQYQKEDNQWISNEQIDNQNQIQQSQDLVINSQQNYQIQNPYYVVDNQVSGVADDLYYVPKKQQQFYYEDDSLSNLQDNLRKGMTGGSNLRGADKNTKKKPLNNLNNNESHQNQISESSIQMLEGGSNSQGVIINPHYYPYHARNNPNRFKSNSDKNNYFKRETDKNNRFTGYPSKIQQEFTEGQNISQDKLSENSKIVGYDNQNQSGFSNNKSSEIDQHKQYGYDNPQQITFSNHKKQVDLNNQSLQNNKSSGSDNYKKQSSNKKLSTLEDHNQPATDNKISDINYQKQPSTYNHNIQHYNELQNQVIQSHAHQDILNTNEHIQKQIQRDAMHHQNQDNIYNQGERVQNNYGNNIEGDENEEYKNNQISSYRVHDKNMNNYDQNEMNDYQQENNQQTPTHNQSLGGLNETYQQVFVGGNINPDKPLICKEHNDYIQLYCQDDKSLLCVNCNYYNPRHQRHRIAPLKRSIDLIKKENQQFKIEAKEKLVLIENSLKICKSNKNILKEGYSFLCESVSKEFADIQRILIEQERKIQSQIQRIFEERLKEYDQMLNDLDYLKSCIREYKDCDKNTSQNLTVYIFSIYSMIRNTLKNIDFSFKSISKNDVYICDFKNNKSIIINEIQKFGKIISDLNIRDPNSTINQPQSHNHQTSSQQKQNGANSKSNLDSNVKQFLDSSKKSNQDSNNKVNSYYNIHQHQNGPSLNNSASKNHIHQGVQIQQFFTPVTSSSLQQQSQNSTHHQNFSHNQNLPHFQNQLQYQNQYNHFNQQHPNQNNSILDSKILPQNQKSSVTSLEGNIHQIQPTMSQQNLHQDAMLQGNHSIHFNQHDNNSGFNQVNQSMLHANQVINNVNLAINHANQAHKNPKSRNQTPSPSPYKHNQKMGGVMQQNIGNNLNNIQYHRDFLDAQYEHSKKQTPRQISHHNNSNQNHQQQNQYKLQQLQHQQMQLQQQQQLDNPHSSYAKLIVSRSTKFSNKKQQQECLKEIQKCQTPPQDRRMNDLVKNMQNISYSTLLEEKYNKRSKSSQKKHQAGQNQYQLQNR